MKVMWLQLSDPGLFQVLHKSQGWPIHLALLSHLQPQLEFPGAGRAVGHGGTQWDTPAVPWGQLECHQSAPILLQGGEIDSASSRFKS